MLVVVLGGANAGAGVTGDADVFDALADFFAVDVFLPVLGFFFSESVEVTRGLSFEDVHGTGVEAFRDRGSVGGSSSSASKSYGVLVFEELSEVLALEVLVVVLLEPAEPSGVLSLGPSRPLGVLELESSASGRVSSLMVTEEKLVTQSSVCVWVCVSVCVCSSSSSPVL